MMRPINPPSIKAVEVDVMGGTHIDYAKRDALTLAIEHQCDAFFTHNDRLFRVSYKDLFDAVRQSPPNGREK